MKVPFSRTSLPILWSNWRRNEGGSVAAVQALRPHEATQGHQVKGSDFETHMFNDHRRMPSDNHLKFLRLWQPLE